MFTSKQKFSFFFRYFEKISIRFGLKGNPIVDIQIAQSKQGIVLAHKYRQMKLVLESSMIKLKEKLGLINLPTDSKSAEIFMTKLKIAYCFGSDATKKKIKDQLGFLNKISGLTKEIKATQKQIRKSNSQNLNFRSVFVTFRNSKHRDFFYFLLEKSSIFALSCLKKQDNELMIRKRIPYAKIPPEPVNIHWTSYSFKTSTKFKRRMISYCVYFLLFTIRKKIKNDCFF